MIRVILLASYFLINNHVFADSASDTEQVFNWAEKTFPDFFSTSSSTVEIELPKSFGKLAGTVRYRKYPKEIYAGVVNDTHVYVLGGMWPQLTYVNTLANLTSQLPNNSNQQSFKANAGADQYLLDRENNGYVCVNS